MALLTACNPVPDLAAGRPASGPTPVILPLDGLLDVADERAAADPGPALAARAAALRARAAGLRGSAAAP